MKHRLLSFGYLCRCVGSPQQSHAGAVDLQLVNARVVSHSAGQARGKHACISISCNGLFPLCFLLPGDCANNEQ